MSDTDLGPLGVLEGLTVVAVLRSREEADGMQVRGEMERSGK